MNSTMVNSGQQTFIYLFIYLLHIYLFIIHYTYRYLEIKHSPCHTSLQGYFLGWHASTSIGRMNLPYFSTYTRGRLNTKENLLN